MSTSSRPEGEPPSNDGAPLRPVERTAPFEAGDEPRPPVSRTLDDPSAAELRAATPAPAGSPGRHDPTIEGFAPPSAALRALPNANADALPPVTERGPEESTAPREAAPAEAPHAGAADDGARGPSALERAVARAVEEASGPKRETPAPPPVGAVAEGPSRGGKVAIALAVVGGIALPSALWLTRRAEGEARTASTASGAGATHTLPSPEASTTASANRFQKGERVQVVVANELRPGEIAEVTPSGYRVRLDDGSEVTASDDRIAGRALGAAPKPGGAKKATAK